MTEPEYVPPTPLTVDVTNVTDGPVFRGDGSVIGGRERVTVPVDDAVTAALTAGFLVLTPVPETPPPPPPKKPRRAPKRPTTTP